MGARILPEVDFDIEVHRPYHSEAKPLANYIMFRSIFPFIYISWVTGTALFSYISALFSETTKLFSYINAFYM